MSTEHFLIDDLLAQLPEIPPDSIVSRTFYSDDRLKAIIFGFAAGQELSEHTGPGTWVHMQPHLPHSIYAETAVVMLLTMV